MTRPQCSPAAVLRPLPARLLAASCCALALAGCATGAGPTRAPAELPRQSVEQQAMARQVAVDGHQARPVGPATYFGSDETAVVSFLRLANVVGPTALQWRWYDPAGELYLVSPPHSVGARQRAFRSSVSAWHRLNVAGEPAARRPGAWRVEVLANGQPLAQSRFSITAGPATDSPIRHAAPPRPADWALVVGVQDYADLPEAAFARRDARLVAAHLHRLLGVPRDQIVTVTDSRATKAALQGYLRRYLPANLAPEGRLYVYYSGHGFPDPGSGRPYLVPHDGNPRFLADSSYALEDFYADLAAIPASETVVFLDACFSGTARDPGQQLIPGMRPGLLTVRHPAGPSGRVVSLSSATASQVSLSLNSAGHGLFTYFLLRGLRGEADADGDGAVDLLELYGFTARRVGQQSRRLGFEQSPELSPEAGRFRGQPMFPLTLIRPAAEI